MSCACHVLARLARTCRLLARLMTRPGCIHGMAMRGHGMIMAWHGAARRGMVRHGVWPSSHHREHSFAHKGMPKQPPCRRCTAGLVRGPNSLPASLTL